MAVAYTTASTAACSRTVPGPISTTGWLRQQQQERGTREGGREGRAAQKKGGTKVVDGVAGSVNREV